MRHPQANVATDLPRITAAASDQVGGVAARHVLRKEAVASSTLMATR